MFFSSTPPLFETKKTQSHTRQLVNPFFSKTFGLKKNFPKKSFCAKPQQLTSFQGWPLDPPIPGSHDENTPKKWSRITPPSLGHEWNWTVGLNGSTKSRKMPRRNISSFFYTHFIGNPAFDTWNALERVLMSRRRSMDWQPLGGALPPSVGSNNDHCHRWSRWDLVNHRKAVVVFLVGSCL